MYVRLKDMYGNITFGLQEDTDIRIIEGNIFSDYSITNKKVKYKEVSLLAPCEPSKVVCVGLNYVDHAKELNLEIPKEPLLFIKPNTSVIGPNTNVIYPIQSSRVDYEAELAVIIGKRAKNISTLDAPQYIKGFTCANDVTARDIQFSDGQWTRGKSFDIFCPLGPGIVSNIDPGKLSITLHVNGELRQESTTENLIFDAYYLVSYISNIMTLLPGDVIITGTPYGVGSVNRGDEMVVSIKGIGSLKNKLI